MRVFKQNLSGPMSGNDMKKHTEQTMQAISKVYLMFNRNLAMSFGISLPDVPPILKTAIMKCLVPKLIHHLKTC